MKKSLVKIAASIIIISAITMSVFAQPGDPGSGDDPDASIPLDGGLVTVLISGAAIGISRLIKKKKDG